MIDFVMCLPAVQRQKLSGNTALFNKQVVAGHNLWISLPEDISSVCQLEVISELGDTKKDIDMSIIYREGSLIKIPEYAVNRELGLHQFEISLKNIITGDMMYCYFQYHIQDDNPDAPYIYMNRKENPDESN